MQPIRKTEEQPTADSGTPAQRILAAVLDAWGWLAGHRLTLAFCAGMLLVGALIVMEAPHRTHRWAPDTFLFLDGGWRVYNGQRPYVDFYTGLGPVTFQLVALGLSLGGVSAAGIDYGFGAAAIGIGFWGWWLFRKRMEAPAAWLLAFSLAVLTISPHALGARLDILTYASIYNRLGYALTAIILVESVLAPLAASAAADEWAGGISTGAACLLLLFLKPSFVVIAAPIVAASYLFRDLRSLRRMLGMAVGFAVPALLMLAYLRFDVGAIWYDLRTVAAARMHPGEADPSTLIGTHAALKHAYEHAEELVGFLLLAWMVTILPRAPRTIRYLDAWWPLLAAAAIFGADLALNTTNGVQYSMPLIGVGSLMLASVMFGWWRSAGPSERREYRWVCAVSLVLALALFVPQALNDVATLAYSARQTRMGPPIEPQFQTASLHRLMSRETPKDWDEPYDGKYLIDPINDGTALLERASRPSESVLALSPINPFSFALQRKPAEGGSPYLGASFFNPGRMPPEEWMIGYANLVMIPKNQVKAAAWLKMVFGDFIGRNYDLAAESDQWWLYRKRAK